MKWDRAYAMPQLDIDRSCILFYAACLLACLLAFLSVQCHMTSHYVCPSVRLSVYSCINVVHLLPQEVLPTSPPLSSLHLLFPPPLPSFSPPPLTSRLISSSHLPSPLLSSPLILQFDSFYSILLSYLTLPFYTLTRQHLPFTRATWHDKKCCIAPFDVIHSMEALFVYFNITRHAHFY